MSIMAISPSSTDTWKACAESLPPESVIVETCIMDEKGQRNVQLLKREGRLWFIPDKAMYVYYTPTHWRHQNDFF
jgi:hypothetical protein